MSTSGKVVAMVPTLSKLTSQGQVSVPAAVRRALGLAPGETMEWIEEDGRIVVRRAVQHDSVDLHRALFPEGKPARRSLADLKSGVAAHLRRKHARD
jgi:antitoxin PrlF